MYYIDYKGIRFIFKTQIRKNSTKITLRIKDGILSFTSPYRLKEKEIIKMIDNNFDAIIKKIEKSKLKEAKPNIIHYLGKAYNVKIIDANYNNVEIIDDDFIIYTKNNNDSYNKKIVHSFYKDFLNNYISYEIIKAKNIYGIDFPIEIKYKTVKSYFGNCYWKKNLIDFNTILAKYDPVYIKTVLYHELGHFFNHDHSANFYFKCEMAFPGFKKYDRALKKIHYKDLY